MANTGTIVFPTSLALGTNNDQRSTRRSSGSTDDVEDSELTIGSYLSPTSFHSRYLDFVTWGRSLNIGGPGNWGRDDNRLPTIGGLTSFATARFQPSMLYWTSLVLRVPDPFPDKRFPQLTKGITCPTMTQWQRRWMHNYGSIVLKGPKSKKGL
jgi:hypothetical protein